MKKSKIKNRLRQFDKETYGRAGITNRICKPYTASISSEKKVLHNFPESGRFWCQIIGNQWFSVMCGLAQGGRTGKRFTGFVTLRIGSPGVLMIYHIVLFFFNEPYGLKTLTFFYPSPFPVSRRACVLLDAPDRSRSFWSQLLSQWSVLADFLFKSL